jgi:general secretion pathway protein M
MTIEPMNARATSDIVGALPNGPRGQFLAVAIALAIAALIWFCVVQPVIAWHASFAEHLAQRRALSQRMAELVSTLPQLQAQAVGKNVSGPTPSAVLQGSTDAIAGAMLQQLVQRMAASAGASLNSVEMVPSQPVGNYHRIGLHIALQAQWPVVVRLLHSVERATPRMFVDDLRLRGPAMQNAALPMDASFTVLAFCAGRPP